MNEQVGYQISWRGLPLAVYREIAAHLRQVKGVEAQLIPQTSQQFNYAHSQVRGLQIYHADALDLGTRQRIEQILNCYQSRYGAWDNLTEKLDE